MIQATILLIDDEEHILKSLRRLFRKEGYELLASNDPLEALELMKKQGVDVIICDQRMPEMTGSELLAAAREIRPDAIRIMLTGYTDLQSAEDAINKGEVWRFLLKPWNDQDLRNTVRQAVMLVEMKRAQRRMVAQIRAQNIELARLSEQLQKKLKSSEQKLEHYDTHIARTEKLASLGLMAGGIAHELNNPLGGILTMTQLLLEDTSEDSPTHADLKEIERATLHSRNVISNLLSFARQGREPKLEELRPKDVIDGVLALVGHSLEIKDIIVEVDVPGDLPAIWGDQNRLHQVFINLLTNAAQAMQRGGTVHIKGRSVEEGKTIAIDVIDSGIGISSRYLDKIFDPFFTTKDEGQGTGLGLSVSYGLIKDHHGEILVASEPDKGAKFTVLLPANNARVNGKELRERESSVSQDALESVSGNE